jgi:hypothetical protein
MQRLEVSCAVRDIYIYIYIYMCVCVCVCVVSRLRVNTNLHHTSPTCFGASNTIFRENLRVP